MNKQLDVNQIVPLIIQYLQNETLPATKQNIFEYVKNQLGIISKSMTVIQQFSRILDEMVMRGYIYTIDNVTYNITRDASNAIQKGEHEDYNAEYSQSHRDLMNKYKDPMKSVNAILPYWEHFKTKHPEYKEVYEDLESMKKEFPMFLAEVWSIIKNKEVQPYKDVEPDYAYSEKLASSIDNVIANCLVRAIKFSRRPKLKNILIPNEAVVNITRELLGAGFEELKKKLIDSTDVGSILSKEDIKTFMAELLKTRNIKDPKEIDFVVRQTMGSLISSIDPMATGIMFDSDKQSVIISTIRKFLFDTGSKAISKQKIINAVLKNNKGTQYVSETLSNATIPPGTKLVKCTFNNLTISNLTAKGVDFSNSTFSQSTITRSDFEGAKFIGCQLDVKTFKNNNIDGADFTNSGGYNSEEVDFSSNTGRPKGLVIQKAVYNTDDFNALVKGGMRRKQYNSLPLTQSERKIADPLMNHLHNFLTHKSRKLTSLEFDSSMEKQAGLVDFLNYLYVSLNNYFYRISKNLEDKNNQLHLDNIDIKSKNLALTIKAVDDFIKLTPHFNVVRYDNFIQFKPHYTDVGFGDLGEEGLEIHKDGTIVLHSFSSKLNNIETNIGESLGSIFYDKALEAMQDSERPDVISSLRFSEEMPNIPEDKDMIKRDLETMLQTGQKSEWLTLPEAKSIIIQLNRSGELAKMGLAQSMGRIIGMISGPKETKPTKDQEEADKITQQEQKLQEVFQQHHGRGTMSKQALIDALPEDALNLKNIINQFPQDQLDAQQISQIYTILLNSQYDSKAGDSVLLQQQLRDISQFPHGSRIDDITSGRRNPPQAAGSKYPNTFGIILEPNLNGLPPEVRSIVEMIDINSPYTLKNRKFTEGMPHNAHWMNAFASARVRPTYIVDNSGVEGSNAKRNVWLDVENQSDALQNANDYYTHLISGESLPYALGTPEIMALSRIYDVVNGKMGVAVPLQSVLSGSTGFDITTLEKLFKGRYITLEGNTTEDPHATVKLNSDKEKQIVGMKSVVAFRNYFRDWPEMVILEIIKRALEHGGVDEIWVPTFEDLMRQRDNKDRRPYYDYAALRLGGVPFHPAMEITPDGGSDLWSNANSKEYYPKTWYAIDLLPYKLDLRKGTKCPSRTDPNTVATVTDLNKLTKFKKSLDTMEVVTPNMADSQIVVVYQLNTAGNKFFISSCKDFSDAYTTKQLYASTDLTLSSDIFGSLYKDKVLRYVQRQLQDFPYLKDVPRNMLIASGITRRQDEFNLGPEEVQQLAEEMQNATGVTMDLPIVNYVKAIITVVDRIKNKDPLGLKSDDSNIINNAINNLISDRVAIGLLKPIIENVLPEALKPQPKEPEGYTEEELKDLSFEPEGETLEFGKEPTTAPIEDRPIADNDPRKKYVDLQFDPNQMSPQGLERHKQHLIDEYLDDLEQAKQEGNQKKIDNINRMLQYLSAESSLKVVGIGGLHPLNKIAEYSAPDLDPEPHVMRKNKNGELYKSYSVAGVGTAFCDKCLKHYEDCNCPMVGKGEVGKTPIRKNMDDMSWLDNDYSATKQDKSDTELNFD